MTAIRLALERGPVSPAVVARLSIEAEYRGWELTRVRLYTDGSRRVLLRRKKSRLDADQPGL